MNGMTGSRTHTSPPGLVVRRNKANGTLMGMFQLLGMLTSTEDTHTAK